MRVNILVFGCYFFFVVGIVNIFVYLIIIFYLFFSIEINELLLFFGLIL